MTCTCLYNNTAEGASSIHQVDARCPEHGGKRMTDDLYTHPTDAELRESGRIANRIAARWPEWTKDFSSSTVAYPNTEPLDDKTLYKEHAS